MTRNFKVNKYIELRLEHNSTNIYINDVLFMHCKYLLLNIPIRDIPKYQNIMSIDDAVEVLDRSMEGNRKHDNRIPIETEFWGHCSNLQAWVEHNYDTRLLHSNLSFPLLKKLADIGDPIAKSRFTEEIALRYSSGCPTVIKYLEAQGYLKYLSKEQLDVLFADIIDNLESKSVPELVSILREYTKKSWDYMKLLVKKELLMRLSSGKLIHSEIHTLQRDGVFNWFTPDELKNAFLNSLDNLEAFRESPNILLIFMRFFSRFDSKEGIDKIKSIILREINEGKQHIFYRSNIIKELKNYFDSYELELVFSEQITKLNLADFKDLESLYRFYHEIQFRTGLNLIKEEIIHRYKEGRETDLKRIRNSEIMEYMSPREVLEIFDQQEFLVKIGEVGKYILSKGYLPSTELLFGNKLHELAKDLINKATFRANANSRSTVEPYDF